MGDRFSGSIVSVAISAAAIVVTNIAVVSVSVAPASAQTQPTSGAAPKTPWGEPDLQGIWTEEFDTPLQRPAKFGNQEFFTDVRIPVRSHFGVMAVAPCAA